MDLQTAKLDLIDWLIGLNDEKIIHKLTSIKNNDTDRLFEQNNQVTQLLDKRLKEKATDFVDARTSLSKIREQHGL